MTSRFATWKYANKSITMDSTSVTTIHSSNVTTLLPYIHEPNEGILFVILSCIILVGFLGNLTFIWTVIRVPSLHTSTYIYLTSLACTDLFTLIGFAINEISTPMLRLENIFLLTAISDVVSWCAFTWSLCLVTLVSLERYLAICHPIRH